MMGYGTGYGYGMMGAYGSGLGWVVGLIVTIDLILVGIWLWQQITRK